MTYNDYYLDIRKRLIAFGLTDESASLEARELMLFVFGMTKDGFFGMRMLRAPDGQTERIYRLLERRLNGEPLAYIIGEWDFYGMTFKVDRRVLIPRADSELLVEIALKLALEHGDERVRVLDLCCGSGCIGAAIAKNSANTSVVLADISRDALDVAERNIVGLKQHPAVVRADALKPPDRFLSTFDIIACNPPYVTKNEYAALDASVKSYEPPTALTDGGDGLAFYRAVSQNWKQAMRNGGTLLFEHGCEQGHSVRNIMMGAGWEDVRTARDLTGHERATFGKLIDLQ